MSQKTISGKQMRKHDLQDQGKKKLINTIFIGAILIYSLILFHKCTDFLFTNWDDPSYITDNLLIRKLNWESIRNIFTTPVIGMYNPLPFLLYAIVYKLFGLSPEHFHTLNVILHLGVVYLVYRFVFLLTNRYESAAITAILFAIHPMHASVVAWVSQTKTSLYFIFYLIGLLRYIHYQKDPKTSTLVHIFMMAVLALLSKPSAVTFAPMLLLLDYYQGRKIDRKVLLEKVPFFVLSIGFGLLTLFSHSEAGDTIFQVQNEYSIFNKLLLANYSLVFYLEKYFLPLNLTSFYTYPDNSTWLPLHYYIAVIAVPLAILLIWKSKEMKKDLIFGMAFFVIALSVVLRVFPSGDFPYANRYSYVSYLGLMFITGQFITRLLDNKIPWLRNWKTTIYVVLAIYFVSFTIGVMQRMEVWKDSVSLFTDMINGDPELETAYNQRAIAREALGDYPGAYSDMQRAIELSPKNDGFLANIAGLEIQMNRYKEAREHLEQALKLNPKNALALNNRGALKIIEADVLGAAEDLARSIQERPSLPNPYFLRGILRINGGDSIGAFSDWRRASSLGMERATNYLKAFKDMPAYHRYEALYDGRSVY